MEGGHWQWNTRRQTRRKGGMRSGCRPADDKVEALTEFVCELGGVDIVTSALTRREHYSGKLLEVDVVAAHAPSQLITSADWPRAQGPHHYAQHAGHGNLPSASMRLKRRSSSSSLFDCLAPVSSAHTRMPYSSAVPRTPAQVGKTRSYQTRSGADLAHALEQRAELVPLDVA